MAEILKMKMSEDDTGEISISQVAEPKENNDIANKKYVDTSLNNLYSELINIKNKIVDELPDVGENGIIYFLKKSSGEENNQYDEYIYLSDISSYEKIGSTILDLTDYLLKTEATNLINSEIVNVLAGEY